MPSIEATLALGDAVSHAGFLHIVVLDPARGPGDHAFDDAVLHEHSVARERWDADYRAYALAKARVSWRTGLDGQVVHATRPHLLASGDPYTWGSVCLDGIVVAVSGAQPQFDEAFATVVAGFVRALAKRRAVGTAETLALP